MFNPKIEYKMRAMNNDNLFREMYTENRSEPRETLMVLQQVEKEGPFSALGFFEVTMATLTAELATIATHVIILLQFKLC